MIFFALLIDGGIHKNASSMGAGPLMVMLTDVLGSQRSKPLYIIFGIIHRGNAYTAVAHFAINIGRWSGLRHIVLQNQTRLITVLPAGLNSHSENVCWFFPARLHPQTSLSDLRLHALKETRRLCMEIRRVHFPCNCHFKISPQSLYLGKYTLPIFWCPINFI